MEVYEEQSFITNPAFTSNIWGQQSTALANNGTVLLKQFNATNAGCRPGMIVGLAPAANPFVSTLNSKLTALGYTVEEFASDSAITSRVRSFEYGVTQGKFCFAVTIA